MILNKPETGTAADSVDPAPFLALVISAKF